MTARPLLVSNDPDLVDDVVRLAAANAVEVHLATDVAGARSKWQLAPLVLVGGDAAMSLAGSGLGRRREIVLVCREPLPDDWKHAVVVGAEHVVSLPEGERWLIDRLADTGEGTPRNGTVMAVVGAGGGSGASTFAPLYPDEMPLFQKIETIAKRIYHASEVIADKSIRDQLKAWEAAGYGKFPICMAKTQYSFSTDPNLKGAPTNHVLPVREVRLSAGAEFIVVICGDIMTMPGLPKVPSAEVIRLNEKGHVEGLF